MTPTFLIIGAQKSGTRWLRVNLGEHPDVFAAEREINFFNPLEVRRLEDYAAEFADAGTAAARGEATPAYMMLRPPKLRSWVADKIEADLPGVRLLAILRNPVDRSVSGFIHFQRSGRIPPDADCFSTLIGTDPAEDRRGLIRGSLYGASLKPFVETFGDRLLVLRHDDIALDATGLYCRAAQHIGVDPGFLPTGLTEVRFSNRTEKSPILDDHQRAAVYAKFEADLDELADSVDIDVSAWRPT